MKRTRLAPVSARLTLRRAQTRARIHAGIVARITDAELSCIEGIQLRAHDRAGVPYGAQLPEGFLQRDEQSRMDAIFRAAGRRTE